MESRQALTLAEKMTLFGTDSPVCRLLATPAATHACTHPASAPDCARTRYALTPCAVSLAPRPHPSAGNHPGAYNANTLARAHDTWCPGNVPASTPTPTRVCTRTRTQAISRVALPQYGWWSEGAHGVAWAGVATVFPALVGVGSTFDKELVGQMGAAVGMEGRAKHNDKVAKYVHACPTQPGTLGVLSHRTLSHFTHHISAPPRRRAEEITERPRGPSGVAAFMSANSKTPYITPGMEFSSGKGVVRGRRVQQLEFTLPRRISHLLCCTLERCCRRSGGGTGSFFGLDFFAPNVNIVRDVRWGTCAHRGLFCWCGRRWFALMLHAAGDGCVAGRAK